MPDSTQSPAGGDVEAREAALKEAIDVYNFGATHNAKNFRDPVAFRAAINHALDAYLAKLTSIKPEPSRIADLVKRLRSPSGIGEPLDHAAMSEAATVIAAIEADRDRLEKLVYVPGLWRCPKCEFQLVQATIYAKTGNVGPHDKIAKMQQRTVQVAQELKGRQGEYVENHCAIPADGAALEAAEIIEAFSSHITAIEADRDALSARIKGLEEERETWAKKWSDKRDDCDTATQEVERLQSDKDRLTKALEDTAKFNRYLIDYGHLGGGGMRAKHGDDPSVGFNNVLRRVRDLDAIISAALSPPSTSQSEGEG